MKKIEIVLAVILLLAVLFACLGFLGYFGVKTAQRAQLRMEARAAFAAEDWKNAEKLLKEYLNKDYDSEEDFIRLAQVYRHFGNTDAEMHCWYRASVLNPLKPERWDLYIECALNARNFAHLYTTLTRKITLKEELSPREKALYLICAVMTSHFKDAEQYYDIMLLDDPEASFLQGDLGGFADFLVTYKRRSPDERAELMGFIEKGLESENGFIRLESILFSLNHFNFSSENEDYVFEQVEMILKQVVAMNRFVGIPLLADFYFSNLRFKSVVEVAEPYLADIENVLLSILYAESCVYSEQPEKLKPLAEHFRSLGRKYSTQVSYFESLYDFSQGTENNNDLARHMQEVGDAAQTDLANLINLQIALNSDSVEKICGSLERIMLNPPFYDLQERARSAARHYLEKKVEENPQSLDDSRMARIAQLISRDEKTDPFLMRIIIHDLHRRNILTRQILQENLNAFPVDPYLLQTAAEFELFNGNPKLCLEYTERFYALKEEKRSNAFDLLHMLALELMGRIDEATKEYTALVDNAEMDRGILYRYFRFCIKHERRAELSKMAERLYSSSVPEQKELAPFFQAEDLFLQGKTEEALSLLETAQTAHLDFAFHAANRFSAHDVLDQALPRYLALVGKHPDRRLIMANLAEIYAAKGMKTEALSYAKQSWETDQDDSFGQYIYAKMLAANDRYQEAERVLRIPYRKINLPDELKTLWTDIMLHCVQEDFTRGHYTNALDRTIHYLILYPADYRFQDFKTRLEQELDIAPVSQNAGQQSAAGQSQPEFP